MAMMLTLCIMSASAQTYCYKFLYNVSDDGVKKQGVVKAGTIFYFTFNSNKSMCYLTTKDGVYTGGYGQNSYRYIGKRNGMYIFKEQNTNMFAQGQNVLLFSEDFDRMNWSCYIDKYASSEMGTRVLKRVENPDYDEIPDELY